MGEPHLRFISLAGVFEPVLPHLLGEGVVAGRGFGAFGRFLWVQLLLEPVDLQDLLLPLELGLLGR